MQPLARSAVALLNCNGVGILQKNCVLGIDIGTTSVKAVAFAEDCCVIAQAQTGLSLSTITDSEAEQDPEEVYEKLTNVMVEVLEHLTAEQFVVLNIGFSSAMHSLLLVSEAGKPLSKVLTWADGRAYKEAEALWKTDLGRELYHETGTPIHPMSPLVKLLWLRQEHKPLFDSAQRFVSLKEWVWHRWFGVWEVDESIASATGLFNVTNRRWNSRALAVVGVSENQLSRVVPTSFLRRGCKEMRLLSTGIQPTTPFNIGASDGVLANLGVGAVENGTMALTMGTSIAVRIQSQEVQTHDEIRSFCYILDKSSYIVGGPSNSGGIVLDWVNTNFIEGRRPIGESLAEAGTVEAEDLFCLPYISGERAPLWDATARAAFIGLGLHHSGIHCLRAAVEGVLFNAYWIAMELFSQVGRPKLLIASGKLFEVKWVHQLLADIFNIPVRIDSTSDASILGAVQLAQAALAGDSLGRMNPAGEDENAVWPHFRQLNCSTGEADAEILQPQNAAACNAKFKEFRRLASLLYFS